MKTAIITGASSGIGEACAKKFAEGGWQLVLLARRTDRLEKLKQQLVNQFNANVFVVSGDVRKRETAQEVANFLTNHCIKPDLLINNAGLAAGLDSFEEANQDDWDLMIDTNLKGLLYMSRAITPLMVANKHGHIINVGSIAGKETYPKGNVYCATKHAVDGLTRAMRLDLHIHNIKITQIAPGAVETEFSEVRFHGDSERAALVYKGFKPLMANDIADAAWYCANVPEHVSIHDLVIMPVAQAAASVIKRNG